MPSQGRLDVVYLRSSSRVGGVLIEELFRRTVHRSRLEYVVVLFARNYIMYLDMISRLHEVQN